MARVRTLVLCVTLWCLMAPSAADAACNPAAGATYNVSDASDNEVGQPSVPGSLRYVTEHASPGAVIGFCENFLVKLLRPITIPHGKAGLQFVGPTTIAEAPAHVFDGELSRPNGKFIVEAENVAFRGLTLQNVNISADQDASGLKVLGSHLSVIAPSSNGKGNVIHLEGRPDEALRDVQIGSDAEPNTIVSDQTEAIFSFYTRRMQIVGNTIDATAGTFAIVDHEGRNLLVRANTILGSFSGEVFSGRIADNKVTASRLNYGIKAFHDVERYGRLTIENNTLGGGGGIRLERDGVAVLGNTVTGARAPGILEQCNGPKGGAVGPVRIEANTLNGNLHGLFYRCGAEAAPAVIKGNHIEASRFIGLGIEGTRVKAAGNTSTASGGHGVSVIAPWGRVALNGNQVFANRGSGVEFQPKARARIIGGAVHDNGAAGVRVERGAAVLISRVPFSANAGPGIDLLPVGVTPNGANKPENRNLDWPAPPAYDPGSGRIRGTTCRGCLVEAFTRESGARAGNPLNGEGAAFLGKVRAGSNGRFTYPAKGRLTCAQALPITFTATQRRGGGSRDPVTSEFSRDVACSDGATQIDTTVGAPVIIGGGPSPG